MGSNRMKDAPQLEVPSSNAIAIRVEAEVSRVLAKGYPL